MDQEEADRLELKHAHNAATSQAAQGARTRMPPLPADIDPTMGVALAIESWGRRTRDTGRWLRFTSEVPVISASVFEPPRKRTAVGYTWCDWLVPGVDESSQDHDAAPVKHPYSKACGCWGCTSQRMVAQPNSLPRTDTVSSSS